MTQSGGRMAQLEKLLEKQPGDPFLLYGMGMEFKKLSDAGKAIEYFDRTIQHDAGYCYAYYQKGLVQESQGDVAAAKATYKQGIEAAVKKGDGHAKEEILAQLAMIDG
jgi:tetratricopeptide (TPR) repeat protein